MVLSADKRNKMVIPDTLDHSHMINALLKDPTYRKLVNDHTEFVECRTHLLRKSSVSEEVCAQGSTAR
jgi:hypothetical protein